MSGLERKAVRTWGVQQLRFHCKGAKSDYKSIKHFWKQYDHGAQITAYVMRTEYSGLTNSDCVNEFGADEELFTVQKNKNPITEEQIKILERLSKPSCGNPNYGRTKI